MELLSLDLLGIQKGKPRNAVRASAIIELLEDRKLGFVHGHDELATTIVFYVLLVAVLDEREKKPERQSQRDRETETKTESAHERERGTDNCVSPQGNKA